MNGRSLTASWPYRLMHIFDPNITMPLTRADAVSEDGYHIANARLSWSSADDKWEVAVFAENITDEEYVVQSFDIAALLGWIEEYYGRPRWVGGSVSYNF